MGPAIQDVAGETWGVTPGGIMFLLLVLAIAARLLFSLFTRTPGSRAGSRRPGMTEDDVRRWNRRARGDLPDRRGGPRRT
jgi:hypothetical protein